MGRKKSGKNNGKRPARVTRIVCACLTVIGLGSLLYYIILIPWLGIRIGFDLIWLALGGSCLGAAFLIRRIPARLRGLQTCLSAAAACLMILAAGTAVCVGAPIVAASFQTPEPGADYMLVLGARVKENGPSVLLQFRIESAAGYLKENEGTTAILCGGQGADEPMSEAQSMYDGLIALGIDPSRLIMEDQSTTTEENIRNAMALMEDGRRKTVITTTGYHLYRSLMTARQLGLTDVSGNPARCAWITPLNYYTREVAALIFVWLFGYPVN